MIPGSDLQFGPFRLSLHPKRLTREGVEVPLTPKAFETLASLVSRAGEVIEKQDLMKAVWGEVFVDESTLTQNIFTIRKALGDGVYIETVPRRGYRFAAPVREVVEEPEIGPARRVLSPKLIASVAAGVVVLAAGGAYVLFQRMAPKPVRSLVVLPFVNLTGDSTKDYFSDGLTEEIINGAVGVQGLRVVARTTAFQFKGKAQDIRKIGEDLHADAVLEGSVRWDQNRLRVTAQLNNTKDGYHLWSRVWERDLHDIFTVQQEIAQSVVDSLTTHAGARPRSRHPTENLEAYQLYLEGRFFREKVWGGSLPKAIDLLEKAIALDPKFAAAYATVSDSYLDLGYTWQMRPRTAFPKAAEAARKAIQLDETYSYAHSVLGLVHLYFDWDWVSSEKELRRAIALDPEDSNAYHYYSHYLVSASRFPESLNMSKQALEFDPLDARLLGHRTWNQAWARNLTEALAVGQKIVDLHPDAGRCCGAYLIWAYEQAGDYQKAIETRQAFGTPHDSTELRRGLTKDGPRGYWQAILKVSAGASPYMQATIHAHLNNTDEAFQLLDRAIAERESWLVYLKVDPRLDSLRSDARFAELVRRVGIPDVTANAAPAPGR